jgi:hypothetical protein
MESVSVTYLPQEVTALYLYNIRLDIAVPDAARLERLIQPRQTRPHVNQWSLGRVKDKIKAREAVGVPRGCVKCYQDVDFAFSFKEPSKRPDLKRLDAVEAEGIRVGGLPTADCRRSSESTDNSQ